MAANSLDPPHAIRTFGYYYYRPLFAQVFWIWSLWPIGLYMLDKASTPPPPSASASVSKTARRSVCKPPRSPIRVPICRDSARRIQLSSSPVARRSFVYHRVAVVVPPVRAQAIHRARAKQDIVVTRVEQPTKDVMQLRVRLASGQRFKYRPGQARRIRVLIYFSHTPAQRAAPRYQRAAGVKSAYDAARPVPLPLLPRALGA